MDIDRKYFFTEHVQCITSFGLRQSLDGKNANDYDTFMAEKILETEERSSRAEQAMKTRQRLFDAAYQLLQEMPFEEVTIRDIVQKAGVSIGTFYLYFAGKLDVYYETFVIADEYFVSTVRPMLTKATALENLLLYFDQYAIYSAEYTSLRLTKLIFNPNNTCFLRTGGEGMGSVLHGIVGQGLQNGELDAALSAEHIETFLMDAVRGLVYNWCLRDGTFDLKAAMHQYILLLYKSIKA